MATQLRDRIDPSLATWPQTPAQPTDPQRLRVAGFTPVLSRVTALPGSPAAGDVVLIRATATGPAAGHEDELARYTGTAWEYATPIEGWHCWVADEGAVYSFDGEVWGARTNAGKYFEPVTLEFWLDASVASGAGEGTEASPWSFATGLESARVVTLLYPLIARCLIRMAGTGNVTYASEPFDSRRFVANGDIIFWGTDFVDVGTYTLAAGSTSGRLILTAPVPGGLTQYKSACVEVMTGAAAGNRKTILGHQKKRDVGLATTANITLSGVQTCDGVSSGTLGSQGRVLVCMQTNPVENGLYTPSSTGPWVRCGDGSRAPLLDNAMVTVAGGNTLAGTTWYQTAASVTPGTTAQVWSQDDTILVPAATTTVAPAAGDTVRIRRPAATLKMPDASSALNALATNFPITGSVTHRGGGGVKLINVTMSSLSFSQVRWDGRITEFGVVYDALTLPIYQSCEALLGAVGTTTDLLWAGVANPLLWSGWGTYWGGGGGNVSANLSTNHRVVGVFHAPAGLNIGHNLGPTMVQMRGGSIGMFADPSGNAFLTRSGTFSFSGNTTPIYMDGGYSSRNEAYVDSSQAVADVIVNNLFWGAIADCREGGRSYTRGRLKGHAVGHFGIAAVGGGFFNCQTTLEVTGDAADLRTVTKTASVGWFTSTDNAVVADPDGSVICRVVSGFDKLETNRITVVVSKSLTAPPGSYAAGDSFIVAAPATGDWLTLEGKLVTATSSSTAPKFDRWIVGALSQDSHFGASAVWVQDEQRLYVRGSSGLVQIGSGASGGAIQTTQDKNLPALATAADGNAALASGISATPLAGCYVGVVVNGVEAVVGDGTKVGVDCYFSGNGGTTARAMNAIVATDTLHWNGSVAGFELATTDRISLNYEV